MTRKAFKTERGTEKRIPGHQFYTAVKETGEIVSYRKPGIVRILKPVKGTDNYFYVSLYDMARKPGAAQANRHTKAIHKLVLRTFKGPAPTVNGEQLVADHIVPDLHNNSLSNLQYVTADQNRAKQDRTYHPRKLTADMVAELKGLFAEGATIKQTAARYGISPTTVKDIRHGRTWKAVTATPVATITEAAA
jgi:hypothetical protein